MPASRAVDLLSAAVAASGSSPPASASVGPSPSGSEVVDWFSCRCRSLKPLKPANREQTDKARLKDNVKGQKRVKIVETTTDSFGDPIYPWNRGTPDKRRQSSESSQDGANSDAGGETGLSDSNGAAPLTVSQRIAAWAQAQGATLPSREHGCGEYYRALLSHALAALPPKGPRVTETTAEVSGDLVAEVTGTPLCEGQREHLRWAVRTYGPQPAFAAMVGAISWGAGLDSRFTGRRAWLTTYAVGTLRRQEREAGVA